MLQVEIEKLPSFMMGQEKGLEKEIEKGLAEGEHKKALTIARQMLNKGFALEDVAQLTGLTLTELTPLDQG